MRLQAFDLRCWFAKTLFALAALICACAPTFDSVARATPLNETPNMVAQVIRSFDVVDDVLDHVGKPASSLCHQHHQQFPHALPTDAFTASALTIEHYAWDNQRLFAPSSSIVDTQERPPRA